MKFKKTTLYDSQYSSELLDHAESFYTFATKYKGKYESSLGTKIVGGFKSWNGFADELTWSSLWLYYRTGKKSYLLRAQKLYQVQHFERLADPFSWDNKHAGIQLLLAEVTKVRSMTSSLRDFSGYCDEAVNGEKSSAGLLFQGEWGVLRYSMNTAFLCLFGSDLGVNDKAWIQMAEEQVKYSVVWQQIEFRVRKSRSN